MGIRVPGDISSAAPFLVLAACHPDAEIRIENVNVNPTRTGILDILRAMKANVELEEERTVGGEPAADIVVRSSQLTATRVDGELIPRAIDELPLVAILGAFAKGETVVADAGELRAKESDRIETMAAALRLMGVAVDGRPDGFSIAGGGSLKGHRVDAHGDHRMGMLAAVAGSLAEGETSVENDAVTVSYPGFWRDLAAAAAGDATPVR
jgi:3-phosphoshikimate 1-carboxyvinyltransferase